MRVLVTGSDGYIGAVLCPYLVGHAFDVYGLDTGLYREGLLYEDDSPEIRTIDKDIRSITAVDLEGFEAVVHLAELSNDPLGQLHPEATRSINYGGTLTLASACNASAVSRFVYASSCSVYGLGDNDLLDESAPLRPQTVYANCKQLAEDALVALASDTFTPVCLRNATVYGISPRMRFDTVLNNLAGMAWVHQRITLNSDGSPWRPIIHVLDLCEAIRCCLSASENQIHAQVFNVGDTAANYRVRELAEETAKVFPDTAVSIGPASTDNRSYRVCFDKIASALGFHFARDVRDGLTELRDLFSRIALSPQQFEAKPFTRVRQIEHLVSSRRLNSELYWSS